MRVGVIGNGELGLRVGLQLRRRIHHRGRAAVVFDAGRERIGPQKQAVARGRTEVVDAGHSREAIGLHGDEKGERTQSVEQSLFCQSVFVGGESACGVAREIQWFCQSVTQVFGDVADRHFHIEHTLPVAHSSRESHLGVALLRPQYAGSADDAFIGRGPLHVLSERNRGQHKIGACLLRNLKRFKSRTFHGFSDQLLHLQRAGSLAVCVGSDALVVEAFAPNEQIVEVEPLDVNDLIHKTVAVNNELLPVVSHGQHPCGHLGGMVVAAGARTLRRPIVTGKQAVLTPVCCAVDRQHRIRRTAVKSITEVAVVGFYDDALVLCRIHSNGHIERAICLQTGAIYLIRRKVGHAFLPIMIAVDGRGIT